jgi:putative transposase
MLMGTVVAPGAATAFKLLLERRQREGSVSAHLVRNVAELFGKSEETIWRWLRQGAIPDGRERLKLNEHELRVLAACGANAKQMTEELVRTGKARANLRTYQRAVKKGSLTPAQLGFFKKGDAGWRAATIHMPVEAGRRGEVFHADHTLLKVWVRTKRRRRWVQVWLTVVLDAYSRRVMGWTVSLQPNEQVVLVALRQAFTGEHGCIPNRMVWDNGAEFLAAGVTAAAQVLAFEAYPIPPYSPWRNGKVERFFRTPNSVFLCKQPFYLRGPRGNNHKLYGPDDGPLMLEEFVERLANWMDEYNRKLPHSALGGKTPEQAWLAEPTALRRAEERHLDFALMRKKERCAISAHGVRHNNRWYYAPEVLSFKSHWIDVGYMPYDNRQIWLFDGEEFVARAVLWDDVPDDIRGAFFERRTGTLLSARAKLPSRITHIEEPAASTLLPLTGPGDFESGEAPTPTTASQGGDDLLMPLNDAVDAAVAAEDDGLADEDRFDDLYGVIE